MVLPPIGLLSSNSIASRKRELGTVHRLRKMPTQSDPRQRTRLRSLSRGSANDGRPMPNCKLGLEGIVSKKLNVLYRSGPSKAWTKVKNPKAPAATRASDGTF